MQRFRLLGFMVLSLWRTHRHTLTFIGVAIPCNYLHQQRWMEVTLAHLFVCLSRAGHLKSYGRIQMKFGGQVERVRRTNGLDLGEDPDLDTIIVKVILHN